MGYGFGVFVLAAVEPDRLDRDETASQLSELAQMYAPTAADRGPASSGLLTSQPLLHPQQQAYLLLAAAGMWRRLDLPLEILRIVGDESPHRRGVVPVGALGAPLRTYWDIARGFLGSDDENTAALVARDLAVMARSYAQAMDSAMANGRLWFNGASPVDVGDIDAVAIALIAARRLGLDLTLAHLGLAMAGLDATARVPLELASEMIRTSLPGNDENL